MQKRVLGKTGFEVSVIGCGGIPIGRASFEEAERTIHEAIDCGINYFDTARGYTGSEERFGRALKGKRDKVYIASQAHGRDRKTIMEQIDTSLKTLGVDYIDVYKMHGIGSVEEAEKVLGPDGAVEGLKKAQQQGKIRHFGASGHNIPAMRRLIQSDEMSVILIYCNFMRSEPATEVFPLAAQHNVGVTVMKPLGGGVFAHPDICLRWVLQHPEVSTISVGMWKPFEVRMNALVGEDPTPLTEQEQEWLEAERRYWDRLSCRMCYEHMPCPNGVNISNMMIADVFYRRNGLGNGFAKSFKAWIEGSTACKRCYQCVMSCPYHLPIPEIIERNARIFGPIVNEYLVAHPQEA